MKINKWTLGLAAVGLVSLTPALRAADAGPTPVNVTALTATTISGYVDTSAVWNPGTGNNNPAPYPNNGGKQDGFNVDSVDIKFASAPNQDATGWGAGYTAEIMYGPDAVGSGIKPVRQAFVSLSTPIGINFEIGQFDGLTGYESTDSGKDPNFTRSYGKALNPTELDGILAAYKFSDEISLELAAANELNPLLNRNNSGGTFGGGNYTIESHKAFAALLTLTAPDSWGWLKGSALDVGADYGPGNSFSHGTTVLAPTLASHPVDQTHLFAGATVMTPVKGLTVGAAFDTVNNADLASTAGNGYTGVETYASAVAGYLSYAVTDKLTLNTRAEYFHASANILALNGAYGAPQDTKIFAVTETVQYDLWANVISRLEVRWDASANGSPLFGGTTTGTPTKHNELMVAANVIYKF